MPGSRGTRRPVTSTYRFVQLAPAALLALVEGRLGAAREVTGVPLPPFFVDDGWLWRIRLADLRRDPSAAPWIARAALCEAGPDAGLVVGHIGFHGAPTPDGMVEVGYTVVPKLRRRGHARGMLGQLLRETAEDHRVRVVRASVAPDNAASAATILGAGFDRVGEQWDEDDGVEVVWEKRLRD